MMIRLEIMPSVSFSADAMPSVKVCDLDADGGELTFVNAIVANVEEFARNWAERNEK